LSVAVLPLERTDTCHRCSTAFDIAGDASCRHWTRLGPSGIPLAEMVKLLENTFRMINIGLASRWKSKQSGIEARVTISRAQ